jgi:hypothetical protein
MKYKILTALLMIIILGLNSAKGQTPHPPINRGAEGMYYWNESIQKYVPGEQAQIDFRQYYSMFPKGEIDVVNYLTGKTFKRILNVPKNEFDKCYFVGMDASSSTPFSYNPYPNATDYAGAPWEFPQNRLRMILSTVDNIVDTFFIWQVEFQPNGAAVLTYFRKGERSFTGGQSQFNESLGRKWYLFLQDPSLNRGLESYLSNLPNGMFREEENFAYIISNNKSNSNNGNNNQDTQAEKKVERKFGKFIKLLNTLSEQPVEIKIINK